MDNWTKGKGGTKGVLSWRRYIPFALVLFFGALLSVLSFVTVKHWELDRIQMELERRAGQTTVASAEGVHSGAGRLRAAAQATLEAVKRSVDASPKAFELVDIKAVTVFDEAAVIVAIAFRYDGKEKRMVGFCVIDDDHPLRAAPLAVLNATNRFLGAVLAGNITWQKSNLLYR